MAKLELEELLEWKQQCSIDLCCEGTQASLGNAGKVLFQSWVEKESYFADDVDTPDRPRNVSGSDATRTRSNSWRLLEHYAVTGTHSNGKHYKDWLFAHAAEKDDSEYRRRSLCAGLKMLMRNVVRNFVEDDRNREKLRKRLRIVDVVPDDAEKNAIDMLDLYDSKTLLESRGQLDVSQAELNDIQPLASDLASLFFVESSERERVVLLASDLGLSITGQTVQTLCNCRKSQLSEARSDFHDRLEQSLDQKFSEIDSVERVCLKARTVQFLLDRIFSWGKSESRLEPLFVEAERIQSVRGMQ